MSFTRRTQRLSTLILSLLTVTLLTTRLTAQVQIDYTDGQTDATSYDTSAPNDPTTLSILSGTATQSGILTGTGSVIKVGAGTLVLSGANDYTGSTKLDGGTLQVVTGGSISHGASPLYIGVDGAGLLDLSGGSVSNGQSYLGVAAGSSGTANVSGGTWTSSDNIQVGYGGTGVLNLSDGSVSNISSYVGYKAGSSGTVNVSGGTWTNNSELTLGLFGSGVLNLSGGSVSNTDAYLGDITRSSGTANVSGGTWTSSGDLTIGTDGTGVLSITGGSVTAQVLHQGLNSGSRGIVNVSNGTLTSNTSYFLGFSGTAVLNLSGGSVSNAASSVGFEVVGSGTANVSGGTWTNNDSLVFGERGTGVLNLSGGSVSNTDGHLGYAQGSSGTANVSGGTWSNNHLFIGWSGSGVLNLSGGTITNINGHVGLQSDGSGTANISGGTWTNTGDLYVGNAGTGVLNLTNSGMISVGSGNGAMQLASDTGSTGTLNLGTGGAAGTLNAASIFGGDGTAVVNFNHTGSLNFTPSLDGSLAVNQIGPGTTTLSTASTYTGPTSVLGGTLELSFVNASPVLSSDTSLTMGSGTLLLTGSGTQTFNGLNTVSGSGRIVLGQDQTLDLGALGTVGSYSALHFSTAAGGADAGASDLGTSLIVLSGLSAGDAINPSFTVTDATGFGLATVDATDHVVRLTTTDLLPATGAVSGSDYRIDNNAGASTDPGSATLIVTSSEAARSITVDTTAGPGVLTLDPGVTLSTDVWNFGGVGTNSYGITGSATAGITTLTAGGLLQINNENTAPVTIDVAILDNGGSGLLHTGTGTTVLTAQSTYTGDTLLSGGVLELAAGGVINTSGITYVGSNVGGGSGGSAVLNLTGGSLTDGGSILGSSLGGVGTANVSAGSWTTTNQSIGGQGTGILNLSGGTLDGGTATLGVDAGSQGTANVSGGTWTLSSDLTVGSAGTGVLNLSGGSIGSTSAYMGEEVGAMGTANVSGGSWTTTGTFAVGKSGTGVLNLSGGSVSGSFMAIGLDAGSSGTANVSGGILANNNQMSVGYDGTGVLNINGGSIDSNLSYLGTHVGSSGTVNMSGGTWSNANGLIVGLDGTGVLNLSGGILDSDGSLVGYAFTSLESNGTVNVSGGTWNNRSNMIIGNQGTGVLNLTDSGVVNVGVGGYGNLYLGTDVAYMSTFGSGTLNIGTGGAAGVLNARQISGAISGSGTAVINFNHTGDFTLNANLVGNITLNQIGPGTTILRGTNTYSDNAPVNVLGGTLKLDFNFFVPSNILSASTYLTLGNGTLQLSGTGTQSLNALTTLANTAGRIVLGSNELLSINALSIGAHSSLNFNTAAGGADASTSALGSSTISLAGSSSGTVLSPTFTVTDATGFGLATTDGAGFVIRLTTTDLLPASGAVIGTDYRIDNNAGTSADPGSATLTIDTSESARSITVDTTAASGVLTLGTGVILDTAVWNFGGAGTHTYEITSSDPAAALTTTDALSVIQFSNFNTAPVTLAVPIIDGPAPVSVLFAGPGTTVLTGVSTYTGDTTVASGELQATGHGSINSLGTTTIGSQTGDHAVLTVDHFDFEDGTGILGAAAGSTGTATIGSHGEWNHTGNFYIGQNGTGVLNIVNGYSATDGDVHIGSGAGSSGTVNVSTSSLFGPQPGVLDVSGTLYVGEEGSGVLTVGDTGVVSADVIKLGAQGTLNIGTGGITGIVDANIITSDSSTAVVNFNVGSFSPPIPFDATLTGALSVNKLGSGITVLDVPSTYTGRTSILGGTLNLDFGLASSDIISSASALTLGGGTLVLSGTGTQTFNGLTTLADTASGIQLDSDTTLSLGALTLGQNSALNFDVSLGGADGATVGSSLITLSGLTVGAVISPGFTVTDATGFGLATINADNQVIRLTTSDLLPATGALGTIDYRIDNNAGSSSDPGSATLTITTSESARSITVDTTAGPGVLTLTGGAVLSTDLWNIGGYSPAYAPYEIASTDATSGISTATAGGMLRINNYAYDEFIISAPILDNGGSGLIVSGPGTTILAGDYDTYTGQTIVSSGASLVITGDRSAVTGAIIVQSSSILSGTGTIGGDVQVQSGGSLVAGQASGCGCGGYTLNGTTVTFQNGSIFLVQGPGDVLSTLHLSGNATIDPGAVISFILAGSLTQNSYTLITAAGGLDGTQSFTTDAFGFDPRYHLVYTGTQLELTRIPPTTAYWTGLVDNKWSTLASDATNWSTTADGLTDPSALPGTPTDVTFSATGAGLQQTDLDADFSINSLTVSSPTVISTTGTQTLTVATTTTISSLLAINSGVTLAGQGDLTIDTTGTLAGTGTVQMAAHQSIFVNGAITVGDPTVPAITGAALTLNLTYPYGGIVMGAGSVINVNLYAGVGLGDNTALLSSSDRLSFRGNLDATAGGTIVIGNPLGLTGFVGGDQWKVLDYNRGSSEITGKLAVNDSSLALATGFFGTFDQTTGIYSIADRRPEITAQSSGLAMANAEGQAIIAGVQTGLNDINNHLFTLRSGGGEEEEESDGGISAALDYGVVVGEGDGPENPMARRIKRTRQWEVFTTVNYGNVKLNPISTQSGVQIDSWASSIGIERHLSRGLTLGFAVTFLQSTQTYTGGLGKIDLEGPMLSAYLAYARKGFWGSLLYSFGAYDLGSQRNPGLGLPSAAGATNAYTNAIQYNTGWNFHFLQDRSLVTGPFIGIDYLHGTVDAYSETGGGLGALRFNKQTFESLVTRVGWSTSKKFHTDWADITPQFRLSYERQNLKNNGTSVSLINAPFTAAGGNQTPGQDYMVLGTGVNFQFTPDFSMLLGYQVQLFRNNMQSHFGSVRFGYKF